MRLPLLLPRLLKLSSDIQRHRTSSPHQRAIRRMPMVAQPGALSDFLQENKSRYLGDVREGRGSGWTISMGNEAGDLDSIASSISLAWCLSGTRNSRDVIALVQTPREDLKLRPENLHALDLSGIDQKALLCPDDIPEAKPFPSSNFALVDHNRLLPKFSDGNPNARVDAIIDHHEDERQHLDADPRTITVPTGSAASLVTEHIRKCGLEIPPDMRILLLSAILIDTAGLKPGGKAEAVDHAAASYLLSHSPTQALGASAFSSLQKQDEPLHPSQAVSTLTQQLLTSKFELSHLTTLEHLRRDYKQYTWTLSPEGRSIAVGLSTVPMDLRIWLSRGSLQDDFWTPLDEFMDKRGLDILGILTTFNDPKKKHNKHKKSGTSSEKSRSTSAQPGSSGTSEGLRPPEKKGKHKRQMLFVVRDGALEQRLWDGIQEDDELDAEERLIRKYAIKNRPKEDRESVGRDGAVAGRIARAYKQGNAKATRKVIAPLLQQIFEGKKGARDEE